MSILETFLNSVWNLQKKGDGTLGNWPNDNYDLQLIRHEGSILVAVTNEDGEDVKKYRVKLEEIK